MKFIINDTKVAANKWVKPPIQIPGTRVYKIVACWLLPDDKPTEATRWQTQGYFVGEEAAWKAFEKESHWRAMSFKGLRFFDQSLKFVRRHPKHNWPDEHA